MQRRLRSEIVISFLFSCYLLLATCYLAFAQTESITLTTYYPSPFGEYQILRLNPHDNIDPLAGCLAAERGRMYYDNTDNQMYICDGTTWQTVGGGGGPWDWDNPNNWVTLVDDANDNVGIGTNNPDAQLNALRSYAGLSNIQQAHFGVTDAGPMNTDVIINRKGNVGGYADFALINALGGGNSRFYVRGDGNVGIGTTNPGARLHISGGNLMLSDTGNPTLFLMDDANDGSRPGIRFGNNQLGFLDGSDIGIQNFGFYSAFSANRNNDAVIRVLGDTLSTGATWGNFIEITHDGNDGIISTDRGDIALMPAGNVGIGTTSPSTNLEVAGEMTISGSETDFWGRGIMFDKNAATTNKWHMGITSQGLNFAETGVADYRLYLRDGGNVGIGTNNPTRTLYVDGQIGMTDGGGSKGIYDIAEDIPAAQDVEAADVVVIDPENNEHVIKSSRPYETTVAGIISTNPAFLIDMKDSDTPLALAGRVKCKVITENGPIKRGDLLVTSSKPGYAMKASPEKLGFGIIIGKALEPLERGEAKITVLVNVN